MHRYPTHQSVIAFDVEGFSDPYRDDSAQAAIRSAVYRLVQESFASAGIPWDACLHEDRGDGAIVVVPPEISKVLLLDPLLSALCASLVDYNRDTRLAERIRLRLAVHAGEITTDEHGLSGTDVVVVCRLLDAEELKVALRHSPVPLAAIVSDGVYDGIVRHRFRNIDPAAYHPVSIKVKRTSLHAWIHLPATSTPPVIERRQDRQDSPSQLRPDVPTFVNRERELRALDHAGRDGRLVVLVGPPGVGKTAFALHWAHRVRTRYDGGQFYADLGGPGRPVALAEVLGRFLRALGVAPQRVPVDPDEQATMFRSLTAGRRLLVLLDNVASAEQVRALLPASPSAVTLVTSRSRLGGLISQGARFVTLDRLGVWAGVELLTRAVGVGRIKAEPGPARELVVLCGGLPIALCVAAARLATRPQWTVEKVVADLVDERRRLARLSLDDDLSVKAVFDVSYQALSPSAARLYRLLGLHPGPDFGTGVAAAVLATSRAEADRLIDELLTASLIEEVEPDRCRFHDLIRLHALSAAQDEESERDRSIGTRRMMDWYLSVATEAGRFVTPHRRGLRRDVEHVPVDQVTFAGHTEALEWLDRERLNLFAAARAAYDQGMPAMAWQLADAMWGLHLYRTHYHDWMRFDLLAVEATRGGPDRAAEAEAEDRLGLLFHALGRNEEALEHMARAADIWRELGERQRIASSTERFGFAYLDQGRAELAIDHFTRALVGYREAGEQRSAGLALISIGRALIESGRFSEAVAPLREARAELGTLPVADPYNHARALLALGRAETGLGDWSAAKEHLDETLARMREVRSPLGEADALWALGELFEKTGDRAAAREFYQRTEALLAGLGNPGVDRVRAQLASLGPS
ncbi:tetratricopeptide repeat protein [Kibdelosporangium persicum]|uniref:ATP/maltotriose-dependent transcriptional regulator MalT n=1 Tax=Kibdelosporangium persicum TaxID=2698649 RepID=A0ABX2F4I6_9PSEU|nr:tetratricopeptide repeat protein [Kibdelosporangium persicum]NRN65915.1 ATP/maltotriose-dependent transcriptional regulator MalT [Kibdelosporangium persicum]